MTTFCRGFFQGTCDATCLQCREAYAQVKAEERAWAQVQQREKRNPGPWQGLGYRSTLEKAALDHRGQP